jgi:hypothetical protein
MAAQLASAKLTLKREGTTANVATAGNNSPQNQQTSLSLLPQTVPVKQPMLFLAGRNPDSSFPDLSGGRLSNIGECSKNYLVIFFFLPGVITVLSIAFGFDTHFVQHLRERKKGGCTQIQMRGY